MVNAPCGATVVYLTNFLVYLYLVYSYLVYSPTEQKLPAEDFGADADKGAAFGNGDGVVVGHAP